MISAARKILLCSLLALAACARTAPSQEAGAQDEWTNPGGDAGKTHHSALTDIGPANVSRLGLAWEAPLDGGRGLEATPVVSDGVLYTSGVAGRVFAFDAASGRALWRFEPEVDMQANRTACCDMVNRGVALARGKVYVGALDGRLYALDAKTGKVVWNVDTLEDHRRGGNITGAPEVAGSVVVIGNAGNEYDSRGYVSALDLDTGKLKWRFHVVPRDPKLGPQASPELEQAVKTWDPNSRWDVGGGGSPWNAINYDPETGLVLVGTGNAEPYVQALRSPKGGTNLFTSSIVALDPKTGRLKWHYQETPSDQWDFDSTAPMILTHLTIDGVDRPVVLHAPKNGFLYVLDRRDGKVLRANKIVRANWAKRVDLATGVPELDRDAADISTGPKVVFPAINGARNWFPPSYDPSTGLYYASVIDMGNLIFSPPGPHSYKPKGLNTGVAMVFSTDLAGTLPTLPPEMARTVTALPAWKSAMANPLKAEIRAIDPLTGKTAWAAPMQGWQDRGGVLTTASGLLVHGTVSGQLRVLNARTGAPLKTIEVGTSILAAPMTYRIKGVQYIAVLAAWGGGGYSYIPRYAAAYNRSNEGRLLVFKLDGGAVPLPALLPPLQVAPEPPVSAVDPKVVAQGRALFFDNCAICHSNQSRTVAPDLRRMTPETHKVFSDIVLRGLYLPAGMPRWDDILSPAQAEAIHTYLIDLQIKTHRDESDKRRRGVPLDSPSAVILTNF
jgi:quinohemoprotein ethanol dehydrogenase